MKSIKLLIWNTVFKWHVQLIQKPDTRKMKYKSTICLIFKNEAPFLREWIEYHKMIGIAHFYLYNNNSDDNYIEILDPYIKKGWVTLIDWPYMQQQKEAYKDCWDRFKDECNWICYLDADEFICMKNERDINDWLVKYAKFPSVHLYWRMFGTSGVLNHDDQKLVTEQYTSCQERLFLYGKNFINTRYEVANWDFIGVHHFPCSWYSFFGKKIRMQSIGSLGHIEAPFEYWDKKGVPIHDIQINHYFCKAWNLMEKKMVRTDVAFKEGPAKNIEEYFYKSEEKCITKDYTIQRYLIRLHNNLKIK